MIRSICFLTFFAALLTGNAQFVVDVPTYYSNLGLTKMYHNPAIFSQNNSQFSTIYRNEFPRFLDSYNHVYLEAEWQKGNWGLAFNANSLIFAYNRDFDLGFDVGYRLYPFDEDSGKRSWVYFAARPVLKFHSIVQNPGTENEIAIGTNNVDLDAGIHFYYEGLEIGVSRTGIFEPDFDYVGIYTERTQPVDHVWLAYRFVPLDEILMEINLNYSTSDKYIDYSVLNVSAVAAWANKVQFGGGYKVGRDRFVDRDFIKSAVIHLGFRSNQILLRYSYDVDLLDNTAPTGGAHEVGLTYVIEQAAYQTDNSEDPIRDF